MGEKYEKKNPSWILTLKQGRNETNRGEARPGAQGSPDFHMFNII